MKGCPVEIEMKHGKLGKGEDGPKIRNACQRCHYRKTKVGKGGDADKELKEARETILKSAGILDKANTKITKLEQELSDAQAEIKRLDAEGKKKKKD